MFNGSRNVFCLVPLTLHCWVLLLPSMLGVGIPSCSASCCPAAGVSASTGPQNEGSEVASDIRSSAAVAQTVAHEWWPKHGWVGPGEPM